MLCVAVLRLGMENRTQRKLRTLEEQIEAVKTALGVDLCGQQPAALRIIAERCEQLAKLSVVDRSAVYLNVEQKRKAK